LQFMLQRVDWRRDLHFQTSTTIDTLDYSGSGLNRGSKVVVAAAGAARRTLSAAVPSGLRLPEGFTLPVICLPGVLAISAPPCRSGRDTVDPLLEEFCHFMASNGGLPEGIPLLVLVDDSDFTARTLNNFLWTVFTRSSPAADIYGLGAFTHCKHWGCSGALVIDARCKPHHAPPLEEEPSVVRRVEALAAPGNALYGLY
ncbi:MAG: UbiD family decarboxylase, partial [Deltaproteobacteria bacterium]|nr:UbiD family decarboxylase [Deltaproteobacteria bacterium]